MDGILVNIGMLEKNRSVIKDMYISKKGDVRRKRVVKSSLSATLVHYCILEIYSNSGYITWKYWLEFKAGNTERMKLYYIFVETL